VCAELCVEALGTWGAHDIMESITIRNDRVINSITFSYRDKDKQLHTAAPWGGAGGTDETTVRKRQ
jgi:hypothetical protein